MIECVNFLLSVYNSCFAGRFAVVNLLRKIHYYILISHSLKSNIRTSEIRSSIAPDHKAIYLSVEINDTFHPGPGTWKFNNQLLEDENYVQLIAQDVYRRLYQSIKKLRAINFYGNLLRWSFALKHTQKQNARNLKTGKLIFRENSMPLIMKYVAETTTVG